MKKIGALAIFILSLPVMADNNQGFYAGIGGAGIKDYQDGIDDIKAIKANEFFAGYKYNNALGLEIRLGKGKTTGTTNYSLAIPDDGSSAFKDADGKPIIKRHVYDIERKISSYNSIYYKPELVNDDAKLYALLGYSSVKTSGVTDDYVISYDKNGKSTKDSAKTKKTSGTFSGLSYGVGVGFVIDQHFNFNIEYRNICDEISGKPNVISANIDYRF